jgi:hypothetical protein
MQYQEQQQRQQQQQEEEVLQCAWSQPCRHIHSATCVEKHLLWFMVFVTTSAAHSCGLTP